MASALLVIAFLVLILIVVLTVLYIVGRRARVRDGETGPGGPVGCGQCGYPARGISGLNCPECGADLREVGIVSPGSGNNVGSTIATLMLYSIGFLIFSGVLFGLIQSQLPTYASQSAFAGLDPASGQFTAEIEVMAEEVIRNNTFHSQGIDFTASTHAFPSTPTTQVNLTLNGVTANTKVQVVRIRVIPNPQPATSWTDPVIRIDPATQVATWTGANGKSHSSQGQMTQKDALSFLGMAGLDVTKQETIDESKQVFNVLDSLARGNNQIVVTGFSSHSAGSSAGWHQGSHWFGMAYSAFFFVLWLVGLVLIARRMNRGRRAPAERA